MGNGVSSGERKAQIGDLIEISRVGYKHWAVYIGDGFVVHLTANDRQPGSSCRGGGSFTIDNKKAFVKKDKLEDAAGGSKWVINNLLDVRYVPHDPLSIKKEALSLVGTEQPYHLLDRNCEHFATQLRYGKSESRQVRKAGEAVVNMSAIGVIGMAVIAAVFILKQ